MEPGSSWLCLPGNDLRGVAFIWAPVPAPLRHTKGAGSQLDWKRVARVLYAISCTSGFVLSWGMAGQVLLKLLHMALPPDHSSVLSSGRSLFSSDSSFGPAGLRPARSHHQICQYGSANPAPSGQWPCIAQRCEQQFYGDVERHEFSDRLLQERVEDKLFNGIGGNSPRCMARPRPSMTQLMINLVPTKTSFFPLS